MYIPAVFRLQALPSRSAGDKVTLRSGIELPYPINALRSSSSGRAGSLIITR